MDLTVTVYDVKQAEKAAGLCLSDDERAAVAAQLDRQMSSYLAVARADCDEPLCGDLLPRRE